MVSDADKESIDSFLQSENSHVSFDLRAERLLGSNDSSTPLHEGETRELLSFYDASLPNSPVYIICLGEDDVLLRLRIKAVNEESLPIEGVERICLQLPNNDTIELKMHQVRETNCDAIDAVCLLQSCLFKDVIAQNIFSSFSGFGGHAYCQQSIIQIHIQLTVPDRRMATLYHIFRYKYFS